VKENFCNLISSLISELWDLDVLIMDRPPDVLEVPLNELSS
jgi:hypothetical protein